MKTQEEVNKEFDEKFKEHFALDYVCKKCGHSWVYHKWIDLNYSDVCTGCRVEECGCKSKDFEYKIRGFFNYNNICEELKSFIKKVRINDIKSLIEWIEAKESHYPEDVFPKPPYGWKQDLWKWCEGKGFSVLRIVGDFARWQEKVCKEEIIFYLKEELEELLIK